MGKTVGAQVTNYHMTSDSGEKILVNLWDCSGNRSFEWMTTIHIKRSGFVIVFYSPYRAESLEVAKGWLKLIEKQNFPKERVWVVRCIRNDEDYRVQE